MRTLIVAHGLEKARIMAAVSIHAPNKLVVLRNTNEISGKLREQVDKQMTALKSEILGKTRKGTKPFPFVTLVDIETQKLDFFDVVGSFLRLQEIITDEQKAGNEVFIDISSGNKTVALSLFLAAQTMKKGVTYCKASSYLDSDEQIVKDVKEPVFVPILPLTLHELNYDIIEKLADVGGITSISDLLRILRLPVDKSNIMSMARKLEELQTYGYVTVTRKGKRKEVQITTQGRQIAGVKK